MSGVVGYDLGGDDDGAVDSEITILFEQCAPIHYDAQQQYGVAQLRGETRRKVVDDLSASLPGAQRRTPTALYNAHLAEGEGEVRVPSALAMKSALRERTEVAHDADVWASLNSMVTRTREGNESEAFLREFSVTPSGVRAVTFNRASIACFRAGVQIEGSTHTHSARERPRARDGETRARGARERRA